MAKFICSGADGCEVCSGRHNVPHELNPVCAVETWCNGKEVHCVPVEEMVICSNAHDCQQVSNHNCPHKVKHIHEPDCALLGTGALCNKGSHCIPYIEQEENPEPEMVICHRRNDCTFNCHGMGTPSKKDECFGKTFQCGYFTDKSGMSPRGSVEVHYVPYHVPEKPKADSYFTWKEGETKSYTPFYSEKVASEDAQQWANGHPGCKAYICEVKGFYVSQEPIAQWHEA